MTSRIVVPFESWADCPHLGDVKSTDDGALYCAVCGERVVYRGRGDHDDD